MNYLKHQRKYRIGNFLVTEDMEILIPLTPSQSKTLEGEVQMHLEREEVRLLLNALASQILHRTNSRLVCTQCSYLLISHYKYYESR